MAKDHKEITIYDIAEALNISPTTVSRGLKDNPTIKLSTRKKIMEMAKNMGYRSNTFASRLRMKRTNTIGTIVPRINSHFMAETIAGIEKVINSAGYNLIITQSHEMLEKEIKSAHTLFNNRVDGLLVSLAYDTTHIDHFLHFLKQGVPVIFFDRVFYHPNCPTIVIDNYKAGFEATEHLLAQGCKRLLHITGNLSKNVYLDRFNGFKEALLKHGELFDDNHLIINDLTQNDGIAAAKKILSMPVKPDGVFVANDNCASSCINELMQQGIKIPNDIAFMGFNNDPVSKVITPALSTVQYPGFEIGQLAARVLINQLEHEYDLKTQTIVLKHELLIRKSSLKTGIHLESDSRTTV